MFILAFCGEFARHGYRLLRLENSRKYGVMMRFFLLLALTIGVVACGQQPKTMGLVESLQPIVSRAAIKTVLGHGRLLEATVVSAVGTSAFVRLRLEGSDELGVEAGEAVADALFTQVKYLNFDIEVVKPRLISPQAIVCSGDTMYAAFTPRVKPTLNNARVVINPGHGWTLRDSGAWLLQRPIPPSLGAFLQEDTNNLEQSAVIADVIAPLISSLGSVRNLNFNAGNGVSGYPKWQEAARHHLQALGVEGGVWNSERDAVETDCNSDKDVRSRPLYANYFNADALLSFHSNANPDSSIRGTRVYIANASFFPSTPASKNSQSDALARAIGSGMVAAIRQDLPGLNWADAQVVNGTNHGENRFAQMPSVIVETGFHTNAGDAAAMTNPIFRSAVARGVKNGLEQFFGVAVPVPSVPQDLTAAMSSDGRMFLSWLEVGSAERYSFAATVAGQVASIPQTVLRGSESRGAAVVTFEANPSNPNLLGQEVCFTMQAVNASGSSAASSSVCLPYAFYSSLSVQNAVSKIPKLTIRLP